MTSSSGTDTAVHTEAELARFSLLIGGADVESESGRTYDSTDPYSASAWARVSDGTAADIDRAVAAARAAGATVRNGVPMLIGQAAVAFERWTGRPAPIDAMRSRSAGRAKPLVCRRGWMPSATNPSVSSNNASS